VEPSPPLALRAEVGRLAREAGRGRAARSVGRAHLPLLLAAALGAFASRAWTPLPGWSALHGALGASLLAALGLWAAPRLLERLLAFGARPSADALARRLDDEHGWRDETTTALDRAEEAGATDVDRFLVLQAAGRLRELPGAPVRRSRVRPGLEAALLFLFVFVLLAPGVAGWIGRSDRPGERPPPPKGGAAYAGKGAPAALPADLWLTRFVEDPPPVEPLPEAAAGEKPR
jgi:hypothetical protein